MTDHVSVFSDDSLIFNPSSSVHSSRYFSPRRSHRGILVAGLTVAWLISVAWATQYRLNGARRWCLVGWKLKAGPVEIVFGCLDKVVACKCGANGVCLVAAA